MPQELIPAIDPALILEAQFQLWMSGGSFRSGSSINTILNALAAAGSLSPVGSVVGSAVANYATNAAITAVIPGDDTIPLITEGTEILSVTITPKTTTNKLRCRFSGQAALSAAVNAVASMFQGSTCIDAIYNSPTANAGTTFELEAEYTPGVTTVQTISVRVGPGVAGTLRMNGTSAGRLFGGASNATLVVEEIKA